jgi:hypothetical protein
VQIDPYTLTIEDGEEASQKSTASNLRLRKAKATDISPKVVKAAPRKRNNSSW